MGPCIINIFQYISNKMQLYTLYLHLETALHVSFGTSIHHQEHIQMYLQHVNKLCKVASCWIYIGIQVNNVRDTGNRVNAKIFIALNWGPLFTVTRITRTLVLKPVLTVCHIACSTKSWVNVLVCARVCVYVCVFVCVCVVYARSRARQAMSDTTESLVLRIRGTLFILMQVSCTGHWSMCFLPRTYTHVFCFYHLKNVLDRDTQKLVEIIWHTVSSVCLFQGEGGRSWKRTGLLQRYQDSPMKILHHSNATVTWIEWLEEMAWN
jgi:hypothetical protein